MYFLFVSLTCRLRIEFGVILSHHRSDIYSASGQRSLLPELELDVLLIKHTDRSNNNKIFRLSHIEVGLVKKYKVIHLNGSFRCCRFFGGFSPSFTPNCSVLRVFLSYIERAFFPSSVFMPLNIYLVMSFIVCEWFYILIRLPFSVVVLRVKKSSHLLFSHPFRRNRPSVFPFLKVFFCRALLLKSSIIFSLSIIVYVSVEMTNHFFDFGISNFWFCCLPFPTSPPSFFIPLFGFRLIAVVSIRLFLLPYFMHIIIQMLPYTHAQFRTNIS